MMRPVYQGWANSLIIPGHFEAVAADLMAGTQRLTGNGRRPGLIPDTLWGDACYPVPESS
jgi:hypothetical protein